MTQDATLGDALAGRSSFMSMQGRKATDMHGQGFALLENHTLMKSSPPLINELCECQWQGYSPRISQNQSKSMCPFVHRCVCVSTPVSKDTTLAISIPMTFQTLYSSRGHGGRSPSRANKAMVFGWKRYWTQYLAPAILILTH